jgi:hypothetical protein
MFYGLQQRAQTERQILKVIITAFGQSKGWFATFVNLQKVVVQLLLKYFSNKMTRHFRKPHLLCRQTGLKGETE